MIPKMGAKFCLMTVVLFLALGAGAQPAPAYVIQVLDQRYSCSARAYYSIGDDHSGGHQMGVTSASVSSPRAEASASVSELWPENQSGYPDYMDVYFGASGSYDGYSGWADVFGSASSSVEITGEFTLMLLKSKGDVSDTVTIPFQTYLDGGGSQRSFDVTMNNKQLSSDYYGEITLTAGPNKFQFRYSEMIGSGGENWLDYAYEASGFIEFWPMGIYVTSAPLPSTPLPGTFLLLGTGLACLVLYRRRPRAAKI